MNSILYVFLLLLIIVIVIKILIMEYEYKLDKKKYEAIKKYLISSLKDVEEYLRRLK